MFYVHRFSGSLGEFEPIGAFTKEDEAQAFAGVTAQGVMSDTGRFYVERDWSTVLDTAMSHRLGPIANVLAAKGLTPFPAQVWTVRRAGAVVAIASSEDEAVRLMDETGGDCFQSVEMDRPFATARIDAA